LKDLADIHFPRARTIVLVQDNLNIHSKASLYEAFPAAEARRLVERFEWHYTPKHGSWLDLAESELGVLSSQCLDRRIPDKQTLIDESPRGADALCCARPASRHLGRHDFALVGQKHKNVCKANPYRQPDWHRHSAGSRARQLREPAGGGPRVSPLAIARIRKGLLIVRVAWGRRSLRRS
jgi:hypothetical protein